MSLFGFAFTKNNSKEYKKTTEEISNELKVDLLKSKEPYLKNGVKINNVFDTFSLNYNGLLAQNGAIEIFAVLGYGNNDNWQNIEQYPMRKVNQNTFETVIPIKHEGNINIAFKDSSNNWDNNKGFNYTFSENN